MKWTKQQIIGSGSTLYADQFRSRGRIAYNSKSQGVSRLFVEFLQDNKYSPQF